METLATSLRSERKWRNVQSVLPESFELVARALEAQTQLIQQLQSRIDDLERVGPTAVSSEFVAASEERLRADTKRRMSRLRKEVSVSLEQQQTAIQEAKEKAQNRTQQQEEAIDNVEQSLEQRCCKMEESLSQLVGSTEQMVEEQNAKLEAQSVKLEAQIVQLKAQQALDDDSLIKLRQDMGQKVATMERKLAAHEARREAAVVPVLKEVAVATPELQEGEMDTIHEDLAQVSKDLRDVESKIEKQLASWRQELVAIIGKKLCKSEATKLLSRKMDTMDAWKQLAEKADSARVEEVAGALMDSVQRSQESTIEELEQLRHISEAKADVLELVQVKHNMHNLVAVAESIQHELSALKRVANEKMTVADAKELLDSQATLNSLQEAMKQVEGAAAGQFTTKSQLDTVAHQVQAITRQLRSEIYQARYVSTTALNGECVL
ncbi:hypothetical protein BBJ29_009035 [Phytophthora kernoviae]|uniref:Uncharacterized protein n=1 Tax=Phytophthora kernoviae TaxID=325452 RepID=A0A3F2RCQ4_9STRA|nr:hypothetical protein BBJ29_009035 [Phytophthora kernoviae]RLN53106.1 hypothetical protein BBP00_00009415 [Phytophthora kernoviae]